MAIAQKSTVKIYTEKELDGLKRQDLEVIIGKYNQLLEGDYSPTKWTNRHSSWRRAVLVAQIIWQNRQAEELAKAPVQDTLFDISAYSQPQSTHQGLAEYRIDTANATVDPSWDEPEQQAIAPDAPNISDDAPNISAEAPNPEAFQSLEEFTPAWDDWASSQLDEAEEDVSHVDAREVWNDHQLNSSFKLRPNTDEYLEHSFLLSRTHKADEIGQLSLLDFDANADDEAPDPDDFPSVAAYEGAWKEWSATHTEQPGFSSPDIESAIAANPQSPIPNPQSPIPNPQSPIPNPQSPITRAEAAAALGVTEDRILKDPTPTLNCVCVVYLDDQGKKRSQFVSYRRFEFWREQLREAIDTASSETIQAVEERMLRELGRFHQHYPRMFGMELKTALSHKRASLFFAKGTSKKSSNEAIAV